MRIIWISDTAPAGLTTDAEYFAGHRLASMRFRIGAPARALARLGVESAFVGLDTPAVLEHLAPGCVDAVVFSKLSTPRGPTYDAFTTAYLGTADHARAHGLAVVVDLVDNVFATERSGFFVELLARADAVTAGTEPLARICRQHARSPVHVVADPVEGERRPPCFAPPGAGLLRRLGLARSAPPLRLLWFGGQYRNFLALAALFPALGDLAAERPLDLVAVMNRDDRLARDLEALCDRAPGRITARFAEWSPAAMAGELERCHLVVLPADARDEMRAVAGANRPARALWAGRAVVAHPLPGYDELRDAALLDADPVGAIRWALAHPAEVAQRIGLGQRIVAARYSPEAIGRRWLEVLESVAPSVPGGTASRS